jgi:glycosyltransferase involved in cell wall biosynthesis
VPEVAVRCPIFGNLMISFIVPAHNEQAGLGRTLQVIHDSARVVGRPYEIIVVDDASTDATAEVARRNQAIVVPVNHRQIAATRNSGGRAARGERLFFVDADTTINPRAVASALRYMDQGAVGGGAAAGFEGVLPLYGRLLGFLIAPIVAKLLGFTGGAFMFCTRGAFHATGGFDERLYCGEEGSLALALKREGRFVVLWERVLTSGRRFRVMSGLQLFGNCARLALSPFTALTQRSSVEKIWYDSNRQRDDIMPTTLGFKVSNAVTLLLLVVLFTGPLWNFVPRSLTPLDSSLGKIRFVTGTFLCHAGLVFWPISLLLFASILRRKQWLEWIKLTALFAFCLWQAWASTQGVIRIWTRLCHWLAHFHNT